MRFAGTPATSAYWGTSFVTTAPAATSAQAPIDTGATQTARAPIEAPSPIVTPTASQSDELLILPSGLIARGN